LTSSKQVCALMSLAAGVQRGLLLGCDAPSECAAVHTAAVVAALLAVGAPLNMYAGCCDTSVLQ
jgi:hypothetical protein